MFDKISNIKYDIKLDQRPMESKNIFRFAYILDSYKDDPKNYLVHSIESGQTMENISSQYYGDSKYSWVILMYNNILDVYEELPKNQNTLSEYIAKKYEPRNVVELKRLFPSTNLPKDGTTSLGNYNGQIVYDESIDRGVKWDSITQNWAPLPQVGYPIPSSRNFDISCNDWNAPEKSIHFLINGVSDPEITLFRGGTYTFKVDYLPNNTFYFTTDDGRTNWRESQFYGRYYDGITEKDFLGSNKITFKVPDNAPNTLYYCSSKTKPYNDNTRVMSNVIRIRNIEDFTYVSQSDRNALQNLNGRVIGKIVKVNDDYYIWNGVATKPNETNFMNGWNLLNPQSEQSYDIPLGLIASSQIPHKYTHNVHDHIITPTTYSMLSNEEKNLYTMQSKYDYEEEKNEKNRTIRIMKKQLLGRFLEHWEGIVA